MDKRCRRSQVRALYVVGEANDRSDNEMKQTRMRKLAQEVLELIMHKSHTASYRGRPQYRGRCVLL